ncbi:MAG: hypothetical protein VB056_01570 [Sphaerochaeta associata]|uniref:hypothetical protein n=1 Tax=Sphaerochaeta associata TaxID=1129264 RepID=UPI002B220738|nr:hypothetical protein [Sphaerochaeta associata]MEA5027541.1 hypothetical protein [Sphaerochaeta associata]
MKKVVLALILVALILVPATAATEGASRSDFAVGLNLGTNTGVGVQYRMNNFDIVGNAGLENFGGTLAADAAANFAVYEFNIEKAKFDVTVGAGLALALPFDGSGVSLEAIFPVGLFYSMDNNDFPLDFYLRVGPTVRIIKGTKANLIGGYGVLGALWRFN